MTKKFRNKYRIPSDRMPNWDYGSDAAYFITICTQDRKWFFGNINDQKMVLNASGQVAHDVWMQIPQQFPYVALGNFVVMPNHVHGILVIDKMGYSSSAVETRLIASLPPPSAPSVPSTTSPKSPGGITGNKNPMFHDNISRIIRWYKGRCTFEIKKNVAAFGWQSRFHDHVIRNDLSYQKIAQYIVDNPKNWKEDKFYS
ncbi:transposase [Gelidibacter japonicus]|uniref:transposase n=1 Tax=Gelidibacter japonicus TaxID=1962232 RepID=UPI002AFFF260|nr:transposase [Gelidibacter japonicus]